MRLLFLTPRQLDDPRSGGTIKSAAVLTHLERGHDVDVVCFRRPDEAPWSRSRGRVVTVPLERERSFRGLVASYLHRVPLSIERNRSAELAAGTRELTSANAYEAVFVDGWLMGSYVPAGFAGRRLLHQHNAEHVMWRRHAELETNPLRRELVRTEAERVRRYERDLVHRFGLVFAVSEDDRRALVALGAPEERVLLLPNVPDPTLLERPELSPRPEPVMLFLATLSWPPNVVGLLRFLRDELPALLERVGGARLIAAGSGASERLMRTLERAGVEYVGAVADDEELYRRARCFVDVGLGGSGSRVKVLNALARGLPVVATRDAVSGLEVTPGEHLLVASEPGGMVAPLERVLTNDALWRALGERGRDLVRRRYIPEIAFAALDEALAKAGRIGP